MGNISINLPLVFSGAGFVQRMILRLGARNWRTGLFAGCRRGYDYRQKYGLVNVKLKWAKDRVLDDVVSAEQDLKAADFLLWVIATSPECRVPIYRLNRCRGQLGIPLQLKISTLLRRYPNVFHESYSPDSAGTPVPWFHLTNEALEIHREVLNILEASHIDIQNRLRKLLMITRDGILPMETIDRLKWDLGLPHNYKKTVILKHPDLFSLVGRPDHTVSLKLLLRDNCLAVSALEKNATVQQKQYDIEQGTLSFPIGFTRGFGLKKKWTRWLEEWQRLPYTSPYTDASLLDPRTDESEKRIVGVFHELLHLTVKKKTERNNVRGLRDPFVLPQKFARVFERHPGIFYISRKSGTETVILREAYDGRSLVYGHPIVEVREKLACLLREGFLDRSKGLYKEQKRSNQVEFTDDTGKDEDSKNCEEDSDDLHLPEYDSDEDLKVKRKLRRMTIVEEQRPMYMTV
ncbi:hypothetical protein MLD38_024678 [Melastoma candidum]|uniref:Uncharacterized protein n=1 Tax=Melastoma candidum TaxID=119954 RepID=A0ACB9NUL1_9MYRT|nr:hypothetical protein MLD38_024678 [Melastoma candidum]